MPKGNIHILSDGTLVPHRDVHNAYGVLMSRATYQGMVNRDNMTRRPFVLTRSSFFGTQKYAAKWTGDNRAKVAEVDDSINELMSLSIAGIPFVGPDVPGFYGDPTDELYIMFY